ncbi:MAG TPA: alanine--glyoxylate aminotransferase family protein [Burkholderiales bacterium]
MDELFEELDPRPRLLMGPGPINAHPQVLRAMGVQLLGQFDPQFRGYMKQVSALYRRVFQTQNRWTLLIDGTARSAIEAALASLVAPGERVLVPVFGRFGHLKVEIARRLGAEVKVLQVDWGGIFPDDILESEIKKFKPGVVAISHGDTSTAMAQPLANLGKICRAAEALLYVDATATLGGMDLPTDAWQLDVVSAGLQKCLGGPPGSAPLTLNERAEAVISKRRHIEEGLRSTNYKAGDGPVIRSNYFDLAMIMDYWSDQALNHHTEATTMLYAARECARVLLGEGLPMAVARHATASRALRAGLEAMGLALYGDPRHRMANITGVHIPAGVNGDQVRRAMLETHDIEIGTSFGPLHGKIWRIGTMGYNARKDAVVQTLAALEKVLLLEKFKLPQGAALDAALAAYR